MQRGNGFFLLVILFFVCGSFQKETFNPIIPGSLHVDRFTPLSGSRVNVPEFTTVYFGASVLDFETIKVTNPVNIDIAGSVFFEGDDVAFSSDGYLYVSTEVNDLPINALHGQLSGTTTDNDVVFWAYYGDVTIDSANSDINLAAPLGAANFEGASVLFQGRQNSKGVNVDANAITIDAGTSENRVSSQVNIEGQDISADLTSSAAITSFVGDIEINGGKGVSIGGYEVDILSATGVSTTADVGDILIETDGTFSLSTNDVNMFSSNGQIYQAVSGDISITSLNSTFVQALDSIVISSFSDSINFNARTDLFVTAGNGIKTRTLGDTNLKSYDFVVQSKYDEVNIAARYGASFNAAARITVTATGDAHVESLSSVAFDGKAVTLNSQIDTSLTAGSSVEFDAENNLELNSNNLYQDFVVSYDYHGNSLDFVSTDEIRFESGLNINFNAYNDMKISSDESIFLSQSLLEFEGNVTSTLSGNSLSISSGQNTLFEADSLSYTIGGSISQSSKNANYTSEQNLNFSTEDFEIDANEINMYAASLALLTADTVSASFSYFATITSTTTTVNADNSINFYSTNTYFSQDGDLSFVSNYIEMDVIVNSFTAGSAEISSDYLEISGTGSHFYARKNFEVSAQDIAIENANDIIMSSDSTLDFAAGDVTINSPNSFNIIATDAFGGDITLTTDSTFKLDSTLTLMTGDLIQWDGESWTVTSTSTYFGCCGNLELNAAATTSITSSNSYFTIDADSSFTVQSGSTTMTAQKDSFTIATTFDGDIYFAGGNIALLAGIDMTFQSEYISYSGSGSGKVLGATSSIKSALDMHIISTANFLFDAINFSQNSDSTSYSGFTSVYVDAPSSLQYTMDTGVINANGGGARFINNGTANNDITAFTIQNTNAASGFRYNFEVDAYNLVAFNSGETVSMQADCTLSVIGGTSEYRAGTDGTGNMIFDASSTFMAYAGGFGNYTMTSAHDFISTAKTSFEVTGYEGARDGFIRTNHNDSDLCIRSNFRSGNTVFESAEFIDVFARGQEEAFLQMFADRSVFVTTQEYSVGVISEGFQTDIQFEINDTIGILLRTTKKDPKSSITIQANGAGGSSVKIFGRDGFETLSKRGYITVDSGENIDIRSAFYDADILIQTYSGNTSIETNNGYYTSGTPSLRYDTMINATGHITFNSGKTIITQRSTIQDPSDSAIIFEGYRGDLLVESTNGDSTYTAQDGGKIFMEARDGDITYSSTDMFITAITGSVEMEGRTGALFSTPGTLTITANGAGGSLHYNTSGGNDYVINQSTSAGVIQFTSTIGEFDFQTTTGLIATATEDIIFAANDASDPSPCTHIYGGGSTNFVSLVDITVSSTETPIQFDAEVEITMDATNVDITTGLLRVTAGGDSTTDGLSIQSQGDVSITTNAADINIDSVAASYIADGNMIFTIDNLNVTSFGDATTENNVVFQTNNGDIVIDSKVSNSYISRSSTIIKSESGITFTTNDNSTSSISFTSSREIRKNSDTMQWTVTHLANFQIKEFLEVANSGDITISVSAGPMGFAADNLLTIEPDHDLTMTSTAGTVLFSTLPFTDGPNSVSFEIDGSATFTVSGDADIEAFRGVDIQGLNGITLTDTTSIAFTAENDMVFTTFHGDITAGLVDSLVINAGRSFYQYSGGEFFVDVDNDMNMRARQIDFTTAGDLTISVVGNIGINSLYHFTLNAETDLTLQSPLQSYTADQSLYLQTLSDLDVQSPIFFEFDSIVFSASTANGITYFDSIGDIKIDGTGLTGINTIDLLSTTGATYFISTGDEGVRFSGTSYAQTSDNDIDITSDSGNIFFFSDTIVNMDGDYIFFNATHAGGNVLTHATGALNVDFVNLYIEPLTNPGTRRHSGNITFIGNSGSISATTSIDVSAAFNAEFSSTFGDITFGLASSIVNIVAQVRNEIEASISQTYNGDTINFTADSTEADFIVEGGAISIDATLAVIDEADDIGFMAGSHFHSLAGDDHNFLALTSSISVISDSSFISFNFDTVNYDISNRLDVQSSAGSIRSIFGGYSLTAASDLIGTTGGAVVINSAQFNAGEDLSFISDANVEINAQDDLSFIASNTIDFRIRGEGDYRTTIGGAVSFTANGGGSINFEAKGNLGALGGKYVLRDDYFDDLPMYFTYNYDPREDAQRKININTIAIEFISVGGSSLYTGVNEINFISKKGNIEIKGVINILYSADFNDRITFFNVISCFEAGGGCGAVTANIGVLHGIPFSYSTDYCAAATAPVGIPDVSCDEISAQLNEVVQAMINYGLLGTSGAINWGGP